MWIPNILTVVYVGVGRARKQAAFTDVWISYKSFSNALF